MGITHVLMLWLQNSLFLHSIVSSTIRLLISALINKLAVLADEKVTNYATGFNLLNFCNVKR